MTKSLRIQNQKQTAVGDIPWNNSPSSRTAGPRTRKSQQLEQLVVELYRWSKLARKRCILEL